ncbi:MAG: hypothetical protein ACHQYP_06025, partial [Nitrospiria bacterium]
DIYTITLETSLIERGVESMGFMIFSRKVQYRGDPAVSFSNLGRISLNKAATNILEKNAVEFILLLWDAERKMVGIRPITKKIENAYVLHVGKRGNGSMFSASTFLKFIGFDMSKTRTMLAKWDDVEAMFVIKVPEEYFMSPSMSPMTTKGIKRKVSAKKAETP